MDALQDRVFPVVVTVNGDGRHIPPTSFKGAPKETNDSNFISNSPSFVPEIASRMVRRITGQLPSRLLNGLQVQSSRGLNLWEGCRECANVGSQRGTIHHYQI